MADAVTAGRLNPDYTQVGLNGIYVDYIYGANNDEEVGGGFVALDFLDAQGNVLTTEKIRFTPAQFSNWNGTIAQARTWAKNNSQILNG